MTRIDKNRGLDTRSRERRVECAKRGFTLVELLVVMVIIATLLSLVAPRYLHSVDRSKEVALQADLRLLRDAIDKHLGDTGQYPASLADLVTKRYIRSVPIDPISDRVDSWILVPYPDRSRSGIFDVRSGAEGLALDGSAYGKW
jgi:general secretion pathway protein G